MSNEDIDLERVIDDPQYRREVIQFLNSAQVEQLSDAKSPEALPVALPVETVN